MRRVASRSLTCVVVSALGLAGATPAQAQCRPAFSSASNYYAHLSPTCVASGDFNGDGRADLAVTNVGGVAILFGTSGGTFSSPLNYPAGDDPQSVAVEDLNGDGWPDLAVANYYSEDVSILFGTGIASNAFAPPISLAAGGPLHFIAIADVSGDSRPDLVVVRADSSNTIAVFPGNGDGTFAAPTTHASGLYPRSLAVGDLNGDGRADVAVSNEYAATVSVLLGEGQGALAPPVAYPTGVAPTSVAIGDLSGDGRPDLAIVGGGTCILLGKGDGTFAPPLLLAPGNSARDIAIADVNGDQRLDLVIVTDATGLNVFVTLGNGNGTFASPAYFSAASGPCSVIVAELGGDRQPDLAVASGSDSVSVLHNVGESVVIVQQPAQQLVAVGGNASFSILALGATSYQWRRNGIALVNGPHFSGVSTDTLSVVGATTAEAGSYTVLMGTSCNAGLLSRSVSLCVTTPVSSCPADFNHSGVISVQDIFDFLAAYFAGCP